MTDAPADEPRFDFFDEGSLSVATYDLLEDAVRSYGEDVPFYLDLCRTAEPVLELGAGTGRVSLALADAGCEVVGLELSAAMLKLAEAKRGRRSAEVAARCAFHVGDMAAFDLGRTFERVLIPYRSFNHLLDDERQAACLTRVREHLTVDGLGVLHLASVDRPEALASAEEMEARRHIRVRVGDTGRVLHWELLSRRVDLLEQVLEQEVRFTLRDSERPIRSDVETYRIAWFTRREIRHLAARCGLEIVAEHGGFSGEPPALGADQVVVFRRAGDR